MKRYKAFMAKYAPGEDANSGIATYGYATASLLVQILKQCGDDLTRANIMKQATNIQNFVADLALPGMTTSTDAERLAHQQAIPDDEIRRPALGSVRADPDGRLQDELNDPREDRI